MFEARAVETGTLRAAFAVMQLAAPEASLAEFRRIVTTGRLEGKSGVVMALFDRRGYVHAIFRARKERQLCGRDLLRLSDFIHGDSSSATILLEMVEALERYCDNVACDQMTVEASRGEGGCALNLAKVLSERGFSGESLLMARRS